MYTKLVYITWFINQYPCTYYFLKIIIFLCSLNTSRFIDPHQPLLLEIIIMVNYFNVFYFLFKFLRHFSCRLHHVTTFLDVILLTRFLFFFLLDVDLFLHSLINIVDLLLFHRYPIKFHHLLWLNLQRFFVHCHLDEI